MEVLGHRRTAFGRSTIWREAFLCRSDDSRIRDLTCDWLRASRVVPRQYLDEEESAEAPVNAAYELDAVGSGDERH